MAINLFLNFLLTIFSYLIPKNPQIILFGSGNGIQFKGNPKYLYLYLHKIKKDQKIIGYWSTENKTLLEKLKKENLPVVYKYSWLNFWLILRSKYIVIEQSVKDFSYLGALNGNFNLLQTWHGTPLKKIGINDEFKKKNIFEQIFTKLLIKEFKNYKIIISSTDKINSILKTVFFNNNVVTLGYPRNDSLFNDNFFLQNNIKDITEKKYKKVIFYAPTFRDNNNNSPFSINFLSELNDVLKKENYIFIVKKHPFDKNLVIPDNLSNIIDVSKNVDDIYEILRYTDILITDYSSVFFDYCLTDKPIIFYCYDLEEYLSKCRDMYFDYQKIIPGPFVKNPEELIDKILNNDWFFDKKYQLKYQEFRRSFNHYLDGNSSKRFYNYIKKIS